MRSPRRHHNPAPDGGRPRTWLSLALVAAFPVALWAVEQTGFVLLYLLVLIAESLLDRCRPELRSLAASCRSARAGRRTGGHTGRVPNPGTRHRSRAGAPRR